MLFFKPESRLEGWLSIPNKGNIKRHGWKKQVEMDIFFFLPQLVGKFFRHTVNWFYSSYLRNKQNNYSNLVCIHYFIEEKSTKKIQI